MNEEQINYNPTGLVKALRAAKESVTAKMIIVPDKLKDETLLELVKMQEKAIEEYQIWIGRALDEIARPSPGFHKYISNCQREAAVMLEQVDRLAEAARVVMDVKEVTGKEVKL